MPVKPSYLILAGAGAIVAYSGLAGKGIGGAVRSVLGGQSPSTAAVATDALITSSPDANTGAGTGAGESDAGPLTTPTGPGETAWFTALLVRLAAPPTAADLTSLHNWRTRESSWNATPPDGATYTHNPLNTTLRTSASIGSINSVGVQRYATAVGGINATASTLTGGYPSIVSALRRGVGLATGDAGVASELSKWSGGGYSSV